MTKDLFANFSRKTFLTHFIISSLTLFVLGFLMLVFTGFEGLHTANIVFFFVINLVSSFVLSFIFQKRGYQTIERIVAAIIITTFILMRIIPAPSEIANRVDTKNENRISEVDRFWNMSEQQIRAVEKGKVITNGKKNLVKFIQYKLKRNQKKFYYFHNDKLIGIIKEFPYNDKLLDIKKNEFIKVYGTSDSKRKGLYMWSLQKTIVGLIPLFRNNIKILAISYSDKRIMKLDNARGILKDIASLRE